MTAISTAVLVERGQQVIRGTCVRNGIRRSFAAPVVDGDKAGARVFVKWVLRDDGSDMPTSAEPTAKAAQEQAEALSALFITTRPKAC